MKYVVQERRKPGTEDYKFYGLVRLSGKITINDIAKEIAEYCTVTRPDILAVLDALQTRIAEHLRRGETLRFDKLGCFRPTMKSGGAATAAAWNPAMVKKVNVVFRPNNEILQTLSVKNITFEKA